MREIEVPNWREKPGNYVPRVGDRVEVMADWCGTILMLLASGYARVQREQGDVRDVPPQQLTFAPPEAEILALCELRQQGWSPAEHLSRWQGPPQHAPAEIQEVPDVGYTCEYLIP